MAQRLATIGWQGISLRAPADWSLVGVNGDEKKGYFRADSPVASAVEVRWSSAGGKTPDLMAKGREFLSTLERTSRKGKARFDSKIRADREQDGSVSFSWRGDRLGQGRLIHCRQCDRVIIAQVVSARDENISHLLPVMLESLRDHRDDGWTDWALYGLEFAVPGGYRIEKQSLMSGYLALTFRRHGRILLVERWGLAGTLLGENPMKEWYRKDAAPEIRGYRVSVEEGQVRGHQGLLLRGRRAGIRQAVKAAAYSATLHPHPKYLTGYVWHCEESNRLFSIRGTSGEGDDTVRRVSEMIECHRDYDV